MKSRIISGILAAAVLFLLQPLGYSVTAETADEWENIFQNGDFEKKDIYGFPKGWDSNGINIFQNGDFEQGTLEEWRREQTVLRWKSLGYANVSLEENTDADAEHGKYYTYLRWNDSKWGGIGVQYDGGMYPLAYDSEYIYRGSYKLSDNIPFPQNAKTQFNTIFYTSEDNFVERVVPVSIQPGNDWQEVSYNYQIREKLDMDEYEYPIFTRWQFRMSTGAPNIGIYVDNLKMEKLGRCDDAEKYTGERSLKIVAYNDGIDEIWSSQKQELGFSGRGIKFGARIKAENLSGRVKIRLNYYDSDNKCILTEEKYIDDPGMSWKEYGFISQMPDKAKTFNMDIAVEGDKGTVWVDDCFVSKRSEESYAAEDRYALWYESNYANMYKGDNHKKAAVAARYYRYFNEEKYLTDAVKSYKQMMEEWASDTGAIGEMGDDFFSGSYIIETYDMLNKLGYTTPEERELMLLYINDFFRPSLKGSHNQVIARAEAMAYAVKAFPEEEQASKWQQWLDEYWQILDTDKDIQEDAGDYNAIAMRDMIRWMQAAGYESRLLDDGWKKMFLRYLYQQAPNGSMPEYGDDFYGRTLDWIYIFEYLAVLYDSPEFAYGARKAFDWGIKNAPNGQFLNSETLELLPVLYGGELYIEKRGSEITTRNLSGGVSARNKILLRNDKGYVWIDNTYNLSHAHKNSKGAVTYYEYDNTPLFHSFERRYIDPRFQNRMAMLEDDEPFPFNNVLGNATNPGRAATGIWYHDSLSLTGLPPSDEENPNLRDLDQICLRLSKEKSSDVSLTIDNIRLEGPAGTYMLCDFEDGGVWNFKGAAYTNVSDGYNSSKAMKVRVDNSSNSVFYTANIYHTFDITQYNCLKWDWKTSNDAGDDMTWLWFVMRVLDLDCDESKVTEAILTGYGDCYVEMQPGEISTYTTNISEAYVEDRNGDSYAKIEMEDFFSTGSLQERRVLLTKEGYLIIQDTIYPTEKAIGYRVGPIWGMYNVLESGSNWFLQAGEKRWYDGLSDSKGKTNGLFVMFSAPDDTRIDSVSVVDGVMTQSASRIIDDSSLQSFITVVVPNINDEKTGQQIADTIEIVEDSLNSSKVSYLSDNGWVHVELGEDGEFNVTRDENNFAYTPKLCISENAVRAEGYVFGEAMPVLAIYDDKELKRVETKAEWIDYGEYGKFSITSDLLQQGSDIKVFVWNDMKPLSKPVNIKYD